MEDKRQLPPSLRGVKKMNGRRYIWLLDASGRPHKHWLDDYRGKSKTQRPKDKD